MTEITLPVVLARFDEIWAVDFEFIAQGGDRPRPICCVAIELRSGRTIRRWGDEMHAPLPIGEDALFVAYFASAEMSCYLALGWALPANVLDLFVEFKSLINGREEELAVRGASLLSALAYFGLSHLDPEVKAQWRERIIQGPPYDEPDRLGILDYCESDVVALRSLLPALTQPLQTRALWLDHALLRGRFMRAVARMEHAGTPLDASTYGRLGHHWDSIRNALVDGVRAQYPIFEGKTLKHDDFGRWLTARGIPWPRTETGRLSMSSETFQSMSRAYPIIAPLRELLHNLGKLRITDISAGSDSRNRTLLSPFRARSGRNQPSNAKFIFGPSVWLRSLIMPAPGHALAYIDFSSQEIAVAAALSGDSSMRRAYQTGDPYLAFAIEAGLAPAGATKATHKVLRDRCKAVVLGTLYGMQEQTLATNLGITSAEARGLLHAHRRTYATFWAWSDRVIDTAMLVGHLDTCFGWRLHITRNTKSTSLLNHPMQSHGAEMLRLACCFVSEAGITICAPVHDALLIEAPESEIDRVVETTRGHMAKASRIVLGGLEIRTDVDLIRPGQRYSDPRGESMWALVQSLLDRLDSQSPIGAEPDRTEPLREPESTAADGWVSVAS